MFLHLETSWPKLSYFSQRLKIAPVLLGFDFNFLFHLKFKYFSKFSLCSAAARELISQVAILLML